MDNKIITWFEEKNCITGEKNYMIKGCHEINDAQKSHKFMTVAHHYLDFIYVSWRHGLHGFGVLNKRRTISTAKCRYGQIECAKNVWNYYDVSRLKLRVISGYSGWLPIYIHYLSFIIDKLPHILPVRDKMNF